MGAARGIGIAAWGIPGGRSAIGLRCQVSSAFLGSSRLGLGAWLDHGEDLGRSTGPARGTPAELTGCLTAWRAQEEAWRARAAGWEPRSAQCALVTAAARAGASKPVTPPGRNGATIRHPSRVLSFASGSLMAVGTGVGNDPPRGENMN